MPHKIWIIEFSGYKHNNELYFLIPYLYLLISFLNSNSKEKVNNQFQFQFFSSPFKHLFAFKFFPLLIPHSFPTSSVLEVYQLMKKSLPLNHYLLLLLHLLFIFIIFFFITTSACSNGGCQVSLSLHRFILIIHQCLFLFHLRSVQFWVHFPPIVDSTDFVMCTAARIMLCSYWLFTWSLLRKLSSIR